MADCVKKGALSELKNRLPHTFLTYVKLTFGSRTDRISDTVYLRASEISHGRAELQGILLREMGAFR